MSRFATQVITYPEMPQVTSTKRSIESRTGWGSLHCILKCNVQVLNARAAINETATETARKLVRDQTQINIALHFCRMAHFLGYVCPSIWLPNSMNVISVESV